MRKDQRPEARESEHQLPQVTPNTRGGRPLALSTQDQERTPLLPHPLTLASLPIWIHHGSYPAVHVSLCPDDVVVVVDDHGTAQHVQVLHHVLLRISQCGDLCVVA